LLGIITSHIIKKTYIEAQTPFFSSSTFLNRLAAITINPVFFHFYFNEYYLIASCTSGMFCSGASSSDIQGCAKI
jgi:hypothetical protein